MADLSVHIGEGDRRVTVSGASNGTPAVIYRIPFAGSDKFSYLAYDNDGVSQGTLESYVGSANDGSLDGAENGTNIVRKTANANGGYDNAGYLNFTYWNTDASDRNLGHTGLPSWFTGYGDGSTPFYVRFRCRWPVIPDMVTEGKWLCTSAGGGASGNRFIVSFGNASEALNGIGGGGTASQVQLICAQNISSNGCPLYLDANTWYHIQLAYQYGTTSTAWIKAWANNNDADNPTSQKAAGTFNTNWPFEAAAYQAGAQFWYGMMSGCLQGSIDWQFDVQDVEFGLVWHPAWYPG